MPPPLLFPAVLILGIAGVDRIVVYATAIVLLGGIIGRALRVIHRASQLLDHVERLPGWMEHVDENRAEMTERLLEVENITQAIARELDIPARRQRSRPRPAPQ